MDSERKHEEPGELEAISAANHDAVERARNELEQLELRILARTLGLAPQEDQ